MNIRSTAVAAAITIALVACGGSEEPSASEPAPPTSNTSLIDEVRRVAAENFEIPPDRVEVGDPEALTPSTCTAVPVWRAEVLDAGTEWYTQIADGSLIKGGDDAALAQVAQSCFLDQGTAPDPDAARSLVLNAGPAFVVQPLDETSGPRILGPLGAEWEPPSVVAAEDGFDISFYVQNVDTFEAYQVSATIRPGEAYTEYRPLG